MASGSQGSKENGCVKIIREIIIGLFIAVVGSVVAGVILFLLQPIFQPKEPTPIKAVQVTAVEPSSTAILWTATLIPDFTQTFVEQWLETSTENARQLTATPTPSKTLLPTTTPTPTATNTLLVTDTREPTLTSPAPLTPRPSIISRTPAAFGQYPCTGTIVDNGTSQRNIVRATPSVDAVLVSPVLPNEKVQVSEKETNKGVLWYKILYGKHTGWIQQDDISLDDNCP